jgi:hypothetical protein
MHQLVSDDERALLAIIATVVRFKKGEEIYREGDRAEAVFNMRQAEARKVPDRRAVTRLSTFQVAAGRWSSSERSKTRRRTEAFQPRRSILSAASLVGRWLVSRMRPGR